LKRHFVLAAILVLALAACDQSVNDNKPEQTSKPPSLTIKNLSSFVLTEVTFSGISFSSPDSNDLLPNDQSMQQLTANDINKTGYINFIRKDIGIALRTEALSITNQDYTFTFIDNSLVEEVGNSANRNSLSQISFLPKIAVEYNNLNIVKNDGVNLRETVINNPHEAEFTIKNTGNGTLLLNTEAVTISSATDIFAAVQPARQEIPPNDSVTFRIIVNPSESRTYNATVTINSNDSAFSFIVTVNAVPPRPIAAVFYENTEVLQNGMIDAGDVMITLSKYLVITIKNTGTEVLTIDTAHIELTGTDAALFTKITNPDNSIPVRSESSFVIEYRPDNTGESNAVMEIPVNDIFRNPIIVYLRATTIPFFNGTVTYNLNGGIGTAPTAQTVTGFSDITLPGGDGFSKDGFNFGGWITNITGSGVSYNANALYTVTGNITLYAKWVIDMVWIEAGIFLMGSPATEPGRNNVYETQHQVTLTNGFNMGKYEVTQAQYVAVTGSNPSLNKGANLPVERVTWYDAIEFCNKLSVLEGLALVYTISERIPLNGYPITNATVTMDLSKNGYRLPTEAEWEYACRAGTTTAYNTGDTISTDQANFNVYSTVTVGNYPPNGWGLYDMHGNAAEWCWDFQNSFTGAPQVDPIGGLSPVLGGGRVRRSGYYESESRYIRSAARGYGVPDEWNSATGFRLVRRGAL